MDTQALTSLPGLVPALIATKFFSLIGCVVLLWDHLLTFEREVEYIWKLPIEFNKVVFVFNRYIVEAFLFFNACIMLGSRNPLSQEMWVERCQNYILFITCTSVVAVAIANLVVTIHIHSLWERRRAATYTLFAGFLITYGVTIVCAGFVVSDFMAHIDWDPKVGLCVILHKPVSLIGLWSGSVAFDIFVLIMVFVNAVDRPYRQNSELVRNLRRDGMKFFSALLLVRSTNLVLAIFSPPTGAFVIIFFPWAILSVTHSRLLLLIKAVERESALERGDDGSHDSTTPVTGFTVTFGDGDNCWRGESIELEVTPWECPWVRDDQTDPDSRPRPTSLPLSLSLSSPTVRPPLPSTNRARSTISSGR